MNIDEAKKSLAENLRNNGINTNSAKGRAAIHYFWVGYMSAHDEVSPFITICLMSGRYEELVAKP